ncbi:MAG: hypothetical protein ACQEQH_01540 [Bacillota bacterium]
MKKLKNIMLFLILLTVFITNGIEAEKINYSTLVNLYSKKSLAYKKLLNQYEVKQNNIELEKYNDLDQKNKLDILNYEIKSLENDYELKELIMQNFNSLFSLYHKVILTKYKLKILKEQLEFEQMILNEIKKKKKKGLITEEKLTRQVYTTKKMQLNIEKELANLDNYKGKLENRLNITDENNRYEIEQRLTDIIIDVKNHENKIYIKLLNKRSKLINLKLKKGSISNLPLKYINKLKKQKILIKNNKKIYKANIKAINNDFKLLNENFKKSYEVMEKRLDIAEREKSTVKKEYSLGLDTKISVLKQDLKISKLKNEKVKIILNYYNTYLKYKSELY